MKNNNGKTTVENHNGKKKMENIIIIY